MKIILKNEILIDYKLKLRIKYKYLVFFLLFNIVLDDFGKL